MSNHKAEPMCWQACNPSFIQKGKGGRLQVRGLPEQLSKTYLRKMWTSEKGGEGIVPGQSACLSCLRPEAQSLVLFWIRNYIIYKLKLFSMILFEDYITLILCFTSN